MAKLTLKKITDALKTMNGWKHSRNSIKKTFKTKGFPQTMAFVSAVGALCQVQDHHPDFCMFKYAELALSFSTHTAGGVTQKDIEIAKAIDLVFENGF
jgi:4a-hydroxytetrahydrobiopterin dehydratase